MIIAFVIDVCEDETLVGSSLLDIVKDGIRNFLEYMNGTRDQYRTKYLLVSSDKRGYCIKGNYIEHNETSCIFWFTDGKNLNWLNNGLVYPKDSEKSTNIYKEKYRWEQRLYTFYLSKSDSPDFPRQLDWINMKMLGQLYKIHTFEQMVHAFDNIICIKDPYPLSKLHHMRPLKKTCGVHLNLVEQVDGSPERINHFVHLYVDPNKINGTYPIPEEYWIEPDAMRGFSPKVVYEHKRPSIPTVIFWKTNKLSADVYDLPPHFSRDIYKLSDCDVSKELLRQKPGIKWPVYVEHSGRQSQGVLGQPFGYLTVIRKDEYTMEACLVLLPYNYIELAQLLRTHNIQNYAEPSMDWRKAMEGYLYNIPWYYYSILASTLKQYYGIYSNIFPILNMERYDSWCKQLTKEADAKFNQMIEENISNRLNLFKPLLLPKKINDSDLIVAKTDSKRCELFDIMEAVIEFDPKHSLPIDIMGSHIPVVKERAKLELRDPEIYRDKVPDKRAYGNPYKNPDKYKKAVQQRRAPKMSPKERQRLLTSPTGIIFNGSFEKEILPFKIVPGRQIILNIPKVHVNTTLPRNPWEAVPVVQTNKINGQMRSYNTKSLTPPPTPPNHNKMSTADLSNVMEIDDNIQNISIPVNETNGVTIPNHEQSLIQKISYTSPGSHYDNHNIIPNGIDKLKRADSTPHISTNSLSQTSIEKTLNNLDVLNQAVELKLKVAINGHSNQAEELLLKKSISPQPEPSGLDILSQVAQDMLGRRAKLSQRVNQRLITLQPVKVDESLSKLTFEIKKKIQSTRTVQEIVGLSDFSKESKAHFVLSIQKYALASSKKDLSKKLQPIVDNLQSLLTKRINSRLTQQLNFVMPRQK
ncbi:6456_t:CDS:10 [Funneliformis geosporum]|uniref:6456_t:CDS:1 n=1 Tax=Funneliformis geosporum TaxID=1117311 RepID=A0A9W4SDN2_9GLOM|nr:6456_t:CDS:10 [Funneliformis geosporum]